MDAHRVSPYEVIHEVRDMLEAAGLEPELRDERLAVVGAEYLLRAFREVAPTIPDRGAEDR